MKCIYQKFFAVYVKLMRCSVHRLSFIIIGLFLQSAASQRFVARVTVARRVPPCFLVRSCGGYQLT